MEIASLVAKSAAGIVENLVSPKIDAFCKKIKIKYEEIMIPKPEHFQEYFVRSYKKYSSANLLAIRNAQKLLQDIYVPLTLLDVSRSNDINHENSLWVINGYPQGMMNQFERVVIVDSAGMGKSTVSKIMFLKIIENDCSRIPIFIELRRLSKTHNILDEISNQLNGINNRFDNSLLLAFIEEGDFIFFLDGFDEISLDNRTEVVRDLQSFIAKAHKNYFVLTSRPEESLVSFGDFRRLSIAPLKKREAYELLRKYDSQGDVSKLLIEKIKLPENAEINDFLVNPLLVSMLFSAFEYKQTIPLKKHLFYRQVYDALFNAHDLSKGDGFIHDKKSKLSIDDFERILRSVGFDCVKCHKTEFAKDELLQLIETAKKRQCIDSFAASDFLDDLVSSVPLFCCDGTLFRWSHKSMAEYFAALFMYYDIKDKLSDLLCRIYESNHLRNYENVLDLFFDIDFKTFRDSITYAFLKDYQTLYIGHNSNQEINVKLLGVGYKVVIAPHDWDPNNFHDLRCVLNLFGNEANDYSWSGIRQIHMNSSHILCMEIKPSPMSVRLSIIFHILFKRQSSLLRREEVEPNFKCLKEGEVYDTHTTYSKDVQDALLFVCDMYNDGLSCWFIPAEVIKQEIGKLEVERTHPNDSIFWGI